MRLPTAQTRKAIMCTAGDKGNMVMQGGLLFDEREPAVEQSVCLPPRDILVMQEISDAIDDHQLWSELLDIFGDAFDEGVKLVRGEGPGNMDMRQDMIGIDMVAAGTPRNMIGINAITTIQIDNAAIKLLHYLHHQPRVHILHHRKRSRSMVHLRGVEAVEKLVNPVYPCGEPELRDSDSVLLPYEHRGSHTTIHS